jgi:hypothetical protein
MDSEFGAWVRSNRRLAFFVITFAIYFVLNYLLLVPLGKTKLWEPFFPDFDYGEAPLAVLYSLFVLTIAVLIAMRIVDLESNKLLKEEYLKGMVSKSEGQQTSSSDPGDTRVVIRSQQILIIFIRVCALYMLVEVLRSAPGNLIYMISHRTELTDPPMTVAINSEWAWIGANVVICAIGLFGAKYLADWICPVEEAIRIDMASPKWHLGAIQFCGLFLMVSGVREFSGIFQNVFDHLYTITTDNEPGETLKVFQWVWYGLAYIIPGYIFVRFPTKVSRILSKYRQG